MSFQSLKAFTQSSTGLHLKDVILFCFGLMNLKMRLKQPRQSISSIIQAERMLQRQMKRSCMVVVTCAAYTHCCCCQPCRNILAALHPILRGNAGHSRSNTSTEASFRMHESIGVETPNLSHANSPAEHSSMDVPRSFASGSSEPNQTADNEDSSQHQQAQRQMSMDDNIRRTGSSPEAQSAEVEPVSSSKPSRTSLRDSLEDQLRSLQVWQSLGHII